jgi:hypothetical protein
MDISFQKTFEMFMGLWYNENKRGGEMIEYISNEERNGNTSSVYRKIYDDLG